MIKGMQYDALMHACMQLTVFVKRTCYYLLLRTAMRFLQRSGRWRIRSADETERIKYIVTEQAFTNESALRASNDKLLITADSERFDAHYSN
jgi:hypothetical protein